MITILNICLYFCDNMAAYVLLFVSTSYLFCVVHSQFLPPVITRDYNGFEYGPMTSSITIIDNSMSLALANTLQSMILNNFLDSSINVTPKYQNSEYLPPCSFVVESITYSPIIDTFYPCETPVYDIYPLSYTDVSPIYLPEAVPMLYTETISYGPPLASDVCYSDIIAPNLQIVPVSCVNSYDVVPFNMMQNVGLIDLIMPPFGGYHDVYTPGVPFYFDNL